MLSQMINRKNRIKMMEMYEPIEEIMFQKEKASG